MRIVALLGVALAALPGFGQAPDLDFGSRPIVPGSSAAIRLPLVITLDNPIGSLMVGSFTATQLSIATMPSLISSSPIDPRNSVGITLKPGGMITTLRIQPSRSTPSVEGQDEDKDGEKDPYAFLTACVTSSSTPAPAFSFERNVALHFDPRMELTFGRTAEVGGRSLNPVLPSGCVRLQAITPLLAVKPGKTIASVPVDHGKMSWANDTDRLLSTSTPPSR